mmetsp:Transcript_5667/g.9469  ORF Transcript_5667/g.9469 Transcript_5667/m.9469 type:complete len:118 (+) Transcript_5667:19-372(+)
MISITHGSNTENGQTMSEITGRSHPSLTSEGQRPGRSQRVACCQRQHCLPGRHAAVPFAEVATAKPSAVELSVAAALLALLMVLVLVVEERPSLAIAPKSSSPPQLATIQPDHKPAG